MSCPSSGLRALASVGVVALVLAVGLALAASVHAAKQPKPTTRRPRRGTATPTPCHDPGRTSRGPPRLELRHHAVPVALVVGRLDRLDGVPLPGLDPRAARGRRRGLRRRRPRQLLGALPATGDRDVAERQLGRHGPLRVDLRRVRRRRHQGLAAGRAGQLRRADADRPAVPAVRPPPERHRLRRRRRVVPQGHLAQRQADHRRGGRGVGRAGPHEGRRPISSWSSTG